MTAESIEPISVEHTLEPSQTHAETIQEVDVAVHPQAHPQAHPLSDEAEAQTSRRLEWIVIILIMIELIYGTINIIERLR